MSNNVDDRIVRMSFESSRFAQGVQATLGLLDKLKQSLNFTGANKGMQNVQDAANKFDMKPMGKTVDAVSARFDAMRVVAYTVIANITNRITNMGINWVKAFTLDPIKAGFQNYEQQINALQTISNNVANEFGNNMKKTNAAVTAALAGLNTYANLTIFDFKDMASAVGQFTAAGLKLPDATATVTGVANAAALAGASTAQFAMVLPQLGQALARGKVMAQDWMSVTNDGLDSLKLKTVILETAQNMGTFVNNTGKAVDVAKEFRPAMEKGAISSNVLKTAFQAFGVVQKGMTDAQIEGRLVALGYSKAQIEGANGILAISKQAYASASNIRTFSALIDNIKQTLASNMAGNFKAIIGDLPQATALFTGISNYISDIANKSNAARAAVLAIWGEHGGRNTLLAGLKSAVQDVTAVFKPIQQAFRDIFPATTGARLLELTHNFKDLMDRLLLSGSAAENLKNTFKGVFAVFDIFHQVIKGVISGVISMFDALGGGSTGGGFLKFTGNIGLAIANFDKFLKQSGVIKTFFQGLGQVLAVPVKLLGGLATAIGGLFAGFGGGSNGNITGTLTGVSDGAKNAGTAIQGVMDKVSPFIQKIHDFFKTLGKGISDSFSSGNFDATNHALETGLFAGALLLLRKFLKDFRLIIFDGENIIGPIKKLFGGLTDSMKAMQAQLKAKTLEEIAIAIGVLTASIVILSAINPAKLTKALGAISVAMGELLVAMAILIKLDPAGFKMSATAAALVLLAGAIDTLVVAIAIMGSLQIDTIAKGLGGVAGALTILLGAVAVISKISGGVLSGAVAVSILAGAMITLSIAMKIMATIKLEDMAKSLGAVALALGIMVGALRLMPAAGMIASATALGIFAIALNGIAIALKIMGTGSWESMGKSMAALAGSLTILVIATRLLSLNISGAFAMVIMAGALVVLAGALKVLGSMSWGDIIKGLTALAGVFVVLGVGSLVLGLIAPELYLVAGALLAFGAAIALVGVGVALFGVGIAALATAMAGGAAAITAALMLIIKMIPYFMEGFAKGVIGMIKVFIDAIPVFVLGIGKLIAAILDTIIKLAPKFGETLIVVIHTMLRIVRQTIPDIIQTGIDLIVAMFDGIRNNAGKIVNSINGAAKAVISALVGALVQDGGDLLGAAGKIMQNLFDGIWNWVTGVYNDLLNIGLRIAGSIIDGIKHGLKSIGNSIKSGLSAVVDPSTYGLGGPTYDALYSVGTTMGLGITDGLNDHLNKPIPSITDKLTANAKIALVQAFNNISNEVEGIGLIQPTIRPILDLSDVHAKASQMNDVLKSTTVVTASTFDKASAIAHVQAAAGQTGVNPPSVVQNIKFEQTNTSPKALSAIEIYRNTNSQLALAKEALKTA